MLVDAALMSCRLHPYLPLQGGTFASRLRHTQDGVHHEAGVVQIVVHGHFKIDSDVAVFLGAAKMYVIVVHAMKHKVVDQPWVTMAVVDNLPILGKNVIEGCVVRDVDGLVRNFITRPHCSGIVTGSGKLLMRPATLKSANGRNLVNLMYRVWTCLYGRQH